MPLPFHIKSPSKDETSRGKKAQKSRPPVPSVSSETSSASRYDNARDYSQTPTQNAEDQPQPWYVHSDEVVFDEIEERHEEPRQQPQHIPPVQAQKFDERQPQIFPAVPIQQPAPVQPQYEYITLRPPTTHVIRQPQQESVVDSYRRLPRDTRIHRDHIFDDRFPAGVIPGHSAKAPTYPNAGAAPSRRHANPSLFGLANHLFNDESMFQDCPRRYECAHARPNAPMIPARRSGTAATWTAGPVNAPELLDVFGDMHDAIGRIEVEMRALKRKMNVAVDMLAARERGGICGFV